MYKKRIIEKELIKAIGNRYITILLGARQTGKTSLLKHIQNISSYDSLFIDLDIFENKQIFSSYTEVMKYLRFNGLNDKKKFILFLDEFHTVSGINKILKNLYDNNENIKIFATGSSSIEIIKKIKESLAGRKNILHLYPLSFKEFLYFKNPELEEMLQKANFKDLPANIEDTLLEHVKDFCVFGGYPAVCNADNQTEKKEIIRSIFDLFVKKDLLETLNIKNPFAIINILKYLSINIGGLINYTTLCTTNHIDINTLKRYLYILSETFIIKIVEPFFVNKNKEIVKRPKIYFHDPGARNYFLNNFSWLDSRTDNGFLIENFVLAEFIKHKDPYCTIKYWRDKNGREVDLITEQDNIIAAYEIKYKNIITTKELSNISYFAKMYPDAKTYLINKNKKIPDQSKILPLLYYEI